MSVMPLRTLAEVMAVAEQASPSALSNGFAGNLDDTTTTALLILWCVLL